MSSKSCRNELLTLSSCLCCGNLVISQMVLFSHLTNVEVVCRSQEVVLVGAVAVTR